MPYNTFSCVLIVGWNLIIRHPLHDSCKNWFVFFYTKQTVFDRNDLMASCCIKPHNKISRLVITYRKLCLVAVSVRILHTDSRKHNCIHFLFCESTDTHQIIFDFLFLKSKLFLVGQCLNLTSSTLPVKWAFRHDAIM